MVGTIQKRNLYSILCKLLKATPRSDVLIALETNYYAVQDKSRAFSYFDASVPLISSTSPCHQLSAFMMRQQKNFYFCSKMQLIK